MRYRNLKKKLIICSLVAAVLTAVILIGAILGGLSQLIAAVKGGNNSYYSGSVENLPEILTIDMINGAIASERKYKVPASVTLAQIILESSGSYPGNLSQMAYEIHNLFGIKGTGPAGYKKYPTAEYYNGVKKIVMAKFRKYHNVAESIDDHGKLLCESRYKKFTKSASTSDEFAKAIHKAGYATSPVYAHTLISLMQEYDLYRFDNYQGKYTGDAGGSGAMIWPCSGSISCEYGYRNCPYHGYELHSGIDIAVATGTDIRAAASGTVKQAYFNSSYGNMILLDNGNGINTLYAHNSRLIVKAGDKVKKGQVIAKSGNSGNSTGPHCHFEVRKNGNPVNPREYLGGKKK